MQLVNMAREATTVISELRRTESPMLDSWLQIRDHLEAAAALLGRLPTSPPSKPLVWVAMNYDVTMPEEESAFDICVGRHLRGETPVREVRVHPRSLGKIARRTNASIAGDMAISVLTPAGVIRFVADREIESEGVCKYYVEVA